MKKHLLIYFIAALFLTFAATSCSEDKNDTHCPIEATEFNSTNGLTITYSGQPLSGKQAKFIPSPNDGSKAQIILSGMPVQVAAGNAGMALNTTGVIPGEATTTLNVNLIVNGNKVSFTGEEKRDGNNVKYAGTVTKSSMNIDFNVELGANEFSGKTFKVTSAEENYPVKFSWEADATITFLGDPNYKIGDLFKLVLGLPIINIEKEKVNAGQALNMVFESFTFLPDGNIQASYKENPKDTEWKKSPINFATYKPVSETRFKLFINIANILESKTARTSKSVNIPELIQTVNELASKLMVEGINIEYNFDATNNIAQFYLNEETLLPILKILNPVLEDEEMRTMLTNLIMQSMGNSDMAPLVGLIVPQLLKDLPKVINSTTELHIGINTNPVE